MGQTQLFAPPEIFSLCDAKPYAHDGKNIFDETTLWENNLKMLIENPNNYPNRIFLKIANFLEAFV